MGLELVANRYARDDLVLAGGNAISTRDVSQVKDRTRAVAADLLVSALRIQVGSLRQEVTCHQFDHW
ncbi:hypothetical protein BCAR13_80127 [Paraburkholderia caribensis]|nr:hypothetical protein BCAR13_80127 [Paraburkholderia caribensis]